MNKKELGKGRPTVQAEVLALTEQLYQLQPFANFNFIFLSMPTKQPTQLTKGSFRPILMLTCLAADCIILMTEFYFLCILSVMYILLSLFCMKHL